MYNNWDELKHECMGCQRCELGATRTNLVFGVGNEKAEVLFIGEGPGEQEDLKGEPFVGRSGQLLDKYLDAIGLDRKKNIYIANMVKCRPPHNRDPKPEEQDACMDFLRAQVRLIQPKIIVCLGRIAAMRLIDPSFRITANHGKFYEKGKFTVCAVYHPSALLRDPSKNKDMYLDLKAVKERLADGD